MRNWSDKEFANHLAEWSTNNQFRRPRMRPGEQGTSLEYALAYFLSNLQRDPSRHHSNDFVGLSPFAWWNAIIIPKKKTIYETSCDMCGIKFYNSSKCNKRKNGYPMYLICQYCHDWSLPKHMQIGAKGKGSFPCSRIIIGESLPVKSGRTFSRQWTSKYKTIANTKLDADVRENESDGKSFYNESEALQEISMFYGFTKYH